MEEFTDKIRLRGERSVFAFTVLKKALDKEPSDRMGCKFKEGS